MLKSGIPSNNVIWQIAHIATVYLWIIFIRFVLILIVILIVVIILIVVLIVILTLVLETMPDPGYTCNK